MNIFQKKINKDTKNSSLKSEYKDFCRRRIVVRAIIKDIILEEDLGEDYIDSAYHDKIWKYADYII